MLFVFSNLIDTKKVINDLKNFISKKDPEFKLSEDMIEEFKDQLILSEELTLCVQPKYVLLALEYAEAINTEVFKNVYDYLDNLVKKK